MAFRLRYPRWGSQSLLITMGLSSYLDYIGWNLSTVEYSIPDYLDEVADYHNNTFRALRMTQIRHLAELFSTEDEYTVTLRPAEDTALCRELVWMANQGYVLSELHDALRYELADEAFNRLKPILVGLTLDEYINAVHPDDRPFHPNRLDARISEYKKKTNNVALNYSSSTLPVPSPGRMRA